MTRITPEMIDAVLPQTQCGLCGHGGCLPYAKAMVYEQAAINLCPPGGVKTLRSLGALLQQDAEPFVEEMTQKTKPPLLAIVREAECIGCTKCIQACPVDAIVGSAKQMHTVITADCTGCELCIPPCPVDCIDLITHPEAPINDAAERNFANASRKRYHARQQRLSTEKNDDRLTAALQPVRENKQAYLQAALARAKAKKTMG